MKEYINEIGAIIAVAMLSDGEAGEAEKQLMKELEEDSEIPGLAASISQAVSMASLLNDDQLTDMLHQNAEKIPDEHKPRVFEAAIATTLADGVISEDEISNILTLAEALDIPMEKAVARMLFEVQEMEGELVVDVEEDLEDFIVVGGKTRYTSIDAFKRMMEDNKYPANVIATMQDVYDWANTRFGDKIVINFTPRFLTVATKTPISRTRTCLFVRLRNDQVRFEYNGNLLEMKDSSGFSDSMKNAIVEFFNAISSVKI